MRKSLIIFFLATLTLNAVSQNGNVKWLTIEEAEKLSKQSFRPMFIDASPTGADGARKWTRILSQIL